MRRRWRLALAVPGAIGFLALAYRVTFVYRWRPGQCDQAGNAVTLLRAAPRSRAADPRPTTGRPRPLRILSYNIEGQAALVRGGYLEKIAAVIREQQPDVVALQEVHRHTWEARYRDQAVE